MNLLCWLLGHKEGQWEMNYDVVTRRITFYCGRCQTPIREVENETLLTDKEYEGFRKIFERDEDLSGSNRAIDRGGLNGSSR